MLFVRPRDRQAEMWAGRRAGPAGAVSTYGADAAYDLSELDTRLREYIVGRPAVYYRPGRRRHDERILRLVTNGAAERARSGRTMPSAIHDPGLILHELRLKKSAVEIDQLKRACEISSLAHREAMRFARPGLYEYQVQAALEYVFRALGSKRDGYSSIVASGNNAWVLHYIDNDQQMEDGDLLLIDAGAEYGHFSADITRSFPINGTFSAPQRSLYEVVLAAHEQTVAAAGPGETLVELHALATRTLTEGMVDLGLLPLGVDESIRYGHHLEFFPHGTSHWLGLDVHDAGAYRISGEGRPLEAGMVFTVEPGLYVDAARDQVAFPLLEHDDVRERERRYLLGAAYQATRAEERAAVETIEHTIPEGLLGIGVRIEDDILITSSGMENLTGDTPTSIDDVEAACSEPSELPLF